MTITKKQPGWLNKKDMAASLHVSVQAFDKWGVSPVEKIGREAFFDMRSVLENRMNAMSRKQQPSPSEPEESVDESEWLKERVRLTRAQADNME